MRAILIMSLGLAFAHAHAAEVYRSVDAAGNVTYSDRPETPDAVPMVIRTAAAAATTRRAPTPARSTEAASDEPDAATIERAEREQNAEDRAANCEAARARSETYETSRRLYRPGADGEREYLTDAEIDEARTNARADIARWCN
jgi:Domain of unknown function (DUF4124)